MVSVPERFEGLLADAVVSRRVHQKHAKEHDMTGYTTRLGVVNLDGCDRTNLCLFDVEEAGELLMTLTWSKGAV